MNSLNNTLREKLPSLTTNRRVRKGGLLYIGKWMCFNNVNCEFLYLAQSFSHQWLGKTLYSNYFPAILSRLSLALLVQTCQWPNLIDEWVVFIIYQMGRENVRLDNTTPVHLSHPHTHARTHTHTRTHARTHTRTHTHTHMHTHTEEVSCDTDSCSCSSWILLFLPLTGSSLADTVLSWACLNSSCVRNYHHMYTNRSTQLHTKRKQKYSRIPPELQLSEPPK